MATSRVLPPGILHYRVERGLFNAAAREHGSNLCPVCAKPGRWVDNCFVCDKDNDKPRCYCKAMHEAGAWAYDEATKTFVMPREVGDGDH